MHSKLEATSEEKEQEQEEGSEVGAASSWSILFLEHRICMLMPPLLANLLAANSV